MDFVLDARHFAYGTLMLKDRGLFSDPALYCRGQYVDLYGPASSLYDDRGESVSCRIRRSIFDRYPSIFIGDQCLTIGQPLSVMQRLLTGGPMLLTLLLLPFFGLFASGGWFVVALWLSRKHAAIFAFDRSGRAYGVAALRCAVCLPLGLMLACLLSLWPLLLPGR